MDERRPGSCFLLVQAIEQRRPIRVLDDRGAVAAHRLGLDRGASV
jgi:hypothetical protein